MQVMDQLVSKTKPQIAATYRSIGSGNGMADFYGLPANNGALPRTAFGCGDVPMSVGLFDNMTAAGKPMLHIPYLVGAVSFFHNVPGVGKVCVRRRMTHAALEHCLCALPRSARHSHSRSYLRDPCSLYLRR